MNIWRRCHERKEKNVNERGQDLENLFFCENPAK